MERIVGKKNKQQENITNRRENRTNRREDGLKKRKMKPIEKYNGTH